MCRAEKGAACGVDVRGGGPASRETELLKPTAAVEKIHAVLLCGGSAFGNYEGNLPRASGRRYFECDIDYDGGYRGPKRLIYSNDGLVFYTEDHYKTFEQLY